MSPTGLGVLEDKTILIEPLSPAAPLLSSRPPWIRSGDRVPFDSSLIFLDERIHLQVGQEEETLPGDSESTTTISMRRGNRFYVENWRRSNLRRRSLYKPGSTCNIGAGRSGCIYCWSASRREQHSSSSNTQAADDGGRGHPTSSASMTKPDPS